MKSLAYYGKKMQHLCSGSWQSARSRVVSWYRNLLLIVAYYYRYLLLRTNPFLLHVVYFVSLSFVGFGILKSLKPRTTEFRPSNLDLFFTCVSAVTVSSVSTVEMEAFSNAQLTVIITLMFVGGEVFTSMLGLHFKRSKIIRTWKSEAKVESVESKDHLTAPSPPRSTCDMDDGHFEMDTVVVVSESGVPRFESHKDIFSSYNPFIKYDSVKFLAFLVLGYLLVLQILGVASVLLYLSLVPSAKHVLSRKGIDTFTFTIFIVVSTFSSCGFMPTNESMMVFNKNTGLLLILIPQILLGNTLFPSCLRFLIWAIGKRFKKEESEYLLNNTREVGHLHLLPRMHSLYLVGTVFAFISIGFVLFCGSEWNSAALSGLSPYEKFVGLFFQSVNARHAGETVMDLSAIAPSLWVFLVVMMYLPPYTSFIPIKRDSNNLELEGRKKTRESFTENFILSQLAYLAIFIILICITERTSLKDDPLNFSVFNIIVEVTSAYGNVGFTTGYSCDRQLRRNQDCVSKWYGFSGHWSNEGKIVLTIIMLFGRMKRFNMNRGQAWKLL